MANFFIRRPVFAWVIAIVIMLGGALAIVTLSISQYPDIAPTTVRITASYDGASAETVEKSVTTIIEDGMTGLDDLTYMTSSSSTGSASVTLTFGNSILPDIAQVQVQNKLQLVQSQLPDVVQQRGIQVARSTSSILMVGALVSTDSKRNSVDLGDVFSTQIEDKIKRLEGVGSIDIFGSGYAMRIWLDPFNLQKYQLTAADVTAAIQAQNTQVSVGSLGGLPSEKGQQLTVTMTAQSQLTTVDEFESIILKVEQGGATVRLSDVARIEIGQESYAASSRQNGLPSTGFAVNLATGANALDTAARVKAALSEIGPTLPQGIEITYPYDTTPFVQLSIEKVVHTLIEAIVLVFVVLLIFLQNLRATFIPMIAVPVVLLGTFGILALAGYSINTLTMFAMVLAIGLLVDDAIVVVENVERIMDEEGLGPLEATEKSMGEITGAIIGIALVLTAVFIPMAFFGGSTGIIYRQFSITIVSAMLLSAVVAIVLTPALCATMLKPIDHHKKRRGIGAWFNRGFDRSTRGYVSTVGYLLKRPLRVFLVFALVIAGCAWLFTRLPSSFLPQEDQGVLLTIVQTPTGSTRARTDEVVKKVEAYFLEQEKANVDVVFGVLGFSFGGSGQNNAIVFTKLKDFGERTGAGQSAAEIVQRASGYFFTLRDAQVFALLPPAIQGLGTTSGFSMYLVDSGNQGNAALTTASQQLQQNVLGNPNISSLRTNSQRTETQLKIVLDQEKLGAMGVDLASVNSMLATIFAGRDVNDFTLNNELKPVYVQGDSPFRMQPDDLKYWYARNTQGEMVPFSSFAKVEWISGSPQLERFNGTSAVALDGAAGPGVSTGQSMDEMERLTAEMPGGYSVAWQGISYQERLSGSQAPMLYALSVLIVFLCLAALYESWSIPFSVILAVPVGVLGALTAAFLFGQANDVYFKVGLLTTIGLAAKNAILIVEFAKDRQEGMGLVEATLEAARLRLRPIIMTSLAFILGVVPLAIATGAGSAAQNAIGIGVLGGMLSATLLGIFFVPSFFVVVRRLSKREKQEMTV